MEIMGWAGYDFVVIDTEHTASCEHKVQDMVRAAQASGITPVVRVRQSADISQPIGLAMDMGARGVMVPMVESGDQAEIIASAAKYPPDGSRTLCVATRGAEWAARRNEFDSFAKARNSEAFTVALVETRPGIEHARAIAEAGIDIIVVGRADLSMSVGARYSPASAEVLEATHAAVQAVRGAGAIAGILAYDVADAHQWIEAGCRFIMLSEPEQILSLFFRQALDAMKKGDTSLNLRLSATGI